MRWCATVSQEVKFFCIVNEIVFSEDVMNGLIRWMRARDTAWSIQCDIYAIAQTHRLYHGDLEAFHPYANMQKYIDKGEFGLTKLSNM